MEYDFDDRVSYVDLKSFLDQNFDDDSGIRGKLAEKAAEEAKAAAAAAAELEVDEAAAFAEQADLFGDDFDYGTETAVAEPKPAQAEEPKPEEKPQE